jgi:solute:Na+ symporter, SSS family
VFLVGVLWPRANRFGATAALLLGAVIGALRFILELMRTSPLVTGSSFLTTFVSINFLHFAILIFAISLFVLVTVSLVTQPETLAKLRGLTFFTLAEDYQPGDARGRAQFRVHAVATAALAVFVIGLWVHFG